MRKIDSGKGLRLMGVVAFNTYDFVQDLKDAGIDEKHAAAISNGILRAHEVADLATKADLREVKSEMRESQAQIKIEIQELRAETKADLGEVKGDIKLLKWMLGVSLAGVSSLIVMGVGLVMKVFFGS